MLPINRLLQIRIRPSQQATPLRYGRKSKDTPSLNAFCCVAPGVLLSAFAIFLTGVLPEKSFQFANIIFGPFAPFRFLYHITGSNVWGAASNTRYRLRQRIFINRSKNMSLLPRE